MNAENTQLIFGPPGTGKTTKLLSIVDELFVKGYTPEEICVVTFTRKGAAEAKQRAIEKFKFTEDRFCWWRTLHSLAFFQLGLSRAQVMGFADYCTLCGQLGISITNKGMSEDGTISGLSKGDRLFFMENMARAQMKTLRAYWEENHFEDIYWYELELLQKTLLQYKAVNGKQDFTDIIYSFINTPVVPDIRILIVDEAQDLTPLQWQMVHKLAQDAEQIYIAGDDDQAIFKWAGADVNHFSSLPGQRTVLPQSYRVPIAVQNVAENIAKRISNRVSKSWKPTTLEGEVIYVNDVSDIDMSSGTWLLLARNMFFLEQYNQHCIQAGLVFDSHIGSPIRGNSLGAIRAWEELRKGNSITASEVKKVYDLMAIKEQVKYGFKSKVDALADDMLLSIADLKTSFGLLTDKIWHQALSKLDETEREYFIAALRRGEKLLREPRIKINTIHSVKGGEADHVVVMTDMANRTWFEYQENPDDEHRVWYVAVTRARKSLFIISPKTDKAYTI